MLPLLIICLNLIDIASAITEETSLLIVILFPALSCVFRANEGMDALSSLLLLLQQAYKAFNLASQELLVPNFHSVLPTPRQLPEELV